MEAIQCHALPEMMQITVVDKHNDALFPIWRARDDGHLPSGGLKLLHFDSHPDLGTMQADDEFMQPSVLIPNIFKNDFENVSVAGATKIGSWILVPVLQGLIDEVTWVHGWWSEQIPAGTYKLVVGRCKHTGRMKVGCPGDKEPPCLEYWYADDSVCKMADFEFCRPWTLHVYRFNKGGILPPAQLKRLVSSFHGGDWILDIDLDFFSTNNPFGSEFSSHFGKDNYKFMAGLFDASLSGNFVEDREDLYDYWGALESTVIDETFHKTPKSFLSADSVQQVVEHLINAGASKKQCSEAMLQWRQMCLDVFPKSATEESATWTTRDLYTNEDLVEIARNTCVPHHITLLPEILRMVNCCDKMFSQIGSRPLICTVATSRADHYLPDEQAAAITTLGLRMLRRQYGNDSVVERADRPEDTAYEYPARFEKPPLPAGKMLTPRKLRTKIFSPRRKKK